MPRVMSERPEFSRPLDLSALDGPAFSLAIEAQAEERAALADRFDLPEIARFEAQLSGSVSDDGERVAVTGRWRADVTQVCGVTLEPFPVALDEAVEQAFERAADPEDTDIDPDPDAPEPFVGEIIDLGEYLAQCLSLALDPFPRKPGAAFENGKESADADPGEAGRTSPFTVLERLKPDPGRGPH